MVLVVPWLLDLRHLDEVLPMSEAHLKVGVSVEIARVGADGADLARGVLDLHVMDYNSVGGAGAGDGGSPGASHSWCRSSLCR